MKNLLLVLVALFLSFYFTSCDNSENDITEDDITEKNNELIVNIESGVGETITMTFTVLKLDSIKNSKMFKNSSFTTVSSYLSTWINVASFNAKLLLKNGTSYVPIAGNCIVSFTSDYGILISFPIKAQNGFGNFIMSTVHYNIKWDEEKNGEVTDIIIF